MNFMEPPPLGWNDFEILLSPIQAYFFTIHLSAVSYHRMDHATDSVGRALNNNKAIFLPL